MTRKKKVEEEREGAEKTAKTGPVMLGKHNMQREVENDVVMT